MGSDWTFFSIVFSDFAYSQDSKSSQVAGICQVLYSQTEALALNHINESKELEQVQRCFKDDFTEIIQVTINI